jgi:hypothetical protein
MFLPWDKGQPKETQGIWYYHLSEREREKEREMNSYARPDVRYCRDYLHSKCKQGLFGILEARLLTSHERNVNNKGQQNDKKPRFNFECK